MEGVCFLFGFRFEVRLHGNGMVERATSPFASTPWQGTAI
jgi:hypothetical protein